MTDYAAPTTIALTVSQYADAHGLSIRTVRRYLSANRLPGASQLPTGEWMIPADAQPTAAPTTGPAPIGAEVSPWTSGVVETTHELLQAGPKVAAELDPLPGMVTLADASRILGIPESAIRRNRDYFGAVPFGPRGALVIPQSALRGIAGV